MRLSSGDAFVSEVLRKGFSVDLLTPDATIHFQEYLLFLHGLDRTTKIMPAFSSLRSNSWNHREAF